MMHIPIKSKKTYGFDYWDKTKFMILSREIPSQKHMQAEDMECKKTHAFKYLCVETNARILGWEYMRLGIASMQMPIKFKLVSVRSELTLYKIMIHPIAFYACQTGAMAKIDGKTFAVFDKRPLW